MSATANPFPPLDRATEAALRASIERFGVLVPVARDQHGRTLDGHHRSRIADELGIDYRVDVITVQSDEHAHEIAVTLNADRRHMDPVQRRELVGVLRRNGHSMRAIAGAVGVDARTVRRDVSGGACAPPDEVTGRDGKRYPGRNALPRAEGLDEQGVLEALGEQAALNTFSEAVGCARAEVVGE